ncbi:hypothetical protein pb186bvf_006262 [Paramecium bursaria]
MTELIGSCNINLEIAYSNKRKACEYNVPYEFTTFQDILEQILRQFQLEQIDDIIFKVNERIIDNNNFKQLLNKFIQPNDQSQIKFLYGPENTVYEIQNRQILKPLQQHIDEDSLVPIGSGDSLIILNRSYVCITIENIFNNERFELNQKLEAIRDKIQKKEIKNFGQFIELYYENCLIETKDYNKTIQEMFIKLITLDKQDRPILNLQYKVKTLGG